MFQMRAGRLLLAGSKMLQRGGKAEIRAGDERKDCYLRVMAWLFCVTAGMLLLIAGLSARDQDVIARQLLREQSARKDATSATPPREITPKTVQVFERWIDAVEHHAPGEPDAALRAAEKWTVDDREELRAGMLLFRDALIKKRVRVKSSSQQRILSLGIGVAINPGAAVFIHHAMMLHGDAAMDAVQRPEELPAAAAAASPSLPGNSAAGHVVLERDGELVGSASSNWHWAFGRALTSVVPFRADQTFVASWFHATTAFLMAHGQYAEASAHVSAATEALPSDPDALFDRACFAEFQGLPQSQALWSTEDLAASRITIRDSLLGEAGEVSKSGVRPPEVENRDAERFFRAALKQNPSFAEARVRLARLLEMRGREAEALSELARAADTGTAIDPIVHFYRELFAGRAERTLGRLDAAAEHFQAALTLFPGAQSARLGASHVALVRGDIDRAAALALEVRGGAADPWWIYGECAGRNAAAVVRAMWALERRQ